MELDLPLSLLVLRHTQLYPVCSHIHTATATAHNPPALYSEE